MNQENQLSFQKQVEPSHAARPVNLKMSDTDAKRNLTELSHSVPRDVECLKTQEALLQNENISPCILVADADDVNLRLVSSLIEKEGFRVIAVSNGREARRILRSSANLVAAIFEVVMPHMSGPDLVRFMKRDERLKDLPVIMMTRINNARFSSESFASGAVALLPEPFSANQLKVLVHMLADRDTERLRKAS